MRCPSDSEWESSGWFGRSGSHSEEDGKICDKADGLKGLFFVAYFSPVAALADDGLDRVPGFWVTSPRMVHGKFIRVSYFESRTSES